MSQHPGPVLRARRAAPFLNVEQLENRDVPSQGAAAPLDSLQIQASEYDPDHLIVATNPSISLEPTGAVALGQGLWRVSRQPNETLAEAAARYSAFPFVRYVQADYAVHLSRTPNDPYFSSQWGLNNIGQNGGATGADIGAPVAWNATTGSPRTIVAVIDTGVDYTHPDLAANIWSNTREVAGNGRDDDGNGFIDDTRGWDFRNNDSDPMDDNGHGTHVAGIIGAVGNNGIGVTGVNWRVQIMPLKFLGADGSGNLSDAIRALNYAVANGATISNNSYGGAYYYQAFVDAITTAQRYGHIFVAAAGNESRNNDLTPSYPASFRADNVISVAALDRSDKLASFSNYGVTSVDLGAPGVNIYSTLPGNRYGQYSGTSMAAPFVTGAVALMRDSHPEWSWREVVSRLLATTDPVASLNGKTVSGGRLDVSRALGAPAADTSAPRITGATFGGSAAGRFDRLLVTFSEAIDPSSFTASDILSFTRDGVAVPGLTYQVVPVTGANNQFEVRFAAQTRAGTYALTLGPEIRDLAGNTLDQNGNGVAGESAGDRYVATGVIQGPRTFESPDLPKVIADLGRATSTLQVNQDVTIGRLSVKLSIQHTYDGDLKITLRSPWGADLVLSNRRGGSGDNFSTVFDDRATTSIANGSAPFLGWHKPEQSLGDFAGRNARGTWTLIVEDQAALDSGRLNGWSIIIEPGANPGTAAGATLPSAATLIEAPAPATTGVAMTSVSPVRMAPATPVPALTFEAPMDASRASAPLQEATLRRSDFRSWLDGTDGEDLLGPGWAESELAR